MTEVVSVKFKNGGKEYFFDPAGNNTKAGDIIIVEMQRGKEMATVSEGNHSVPDDMIVQPLRKMLRHANEKDFERAKENRQKEAEAFKICE